MCSPGRTHKHVIFPVVWFATRTVWGSTILYLEQLPKSRNVSSKEQASRLPVFLKKNSEAALPSPWTDSNCKGRPVDNVYITIASPCTAKERINTSIGVILRIDKRQDVIFILDLTRFNHLFLTQHYCDSQQNQTQINLKKNSTSSRCSGPKLQRPFWTRFS